MALHIGDMAPGFELYDTEKNKVSPGDFKGQQLLILFFPLAFTSTCTEELCSVRDNINLYQNLEATVIGISVDSTYTLARYRQDQQLNFRLLSDFNREASERYNCLYDVFGKMKMKGVSKRAAFVIDKQGVIQYSEVLEDAGKVPDFEAIRAVLKRLSN